jgi:hypothetical protein
MMTIPQNVKLMMADIDLFCKLANWNMLECLPGLFDCKWNEIASLSTLKFRIQRELRSENFKLLRTTKIAERALEIVESMGTLPEPSSELISHLQSVPTIDPGEAILFAIASKYENANLLTGDKRALMGLHATTHVLNLLSIDRRIVCLEQVVGAILLEKGITWLRTKVCPYKDVDKSISAVMGGKCDADQDTVQEGLYSYVRDVASKTGELLNETIFPLPSTMA